jgi:hypothetical protein
MADSRYIMGLFRDETGAAAAVRDLEGSPFRFQKGFSPVPSHRLAEAIRVRKSRVGYFTLIGGVIGFFAGFFLAIFTATRWSLIVSGKPVVALIPFVIVGFEFTILFAVFGNILGFLFTTDLPKFDWSRHYDPRTSGQYFGILASCSADQETALVKFFEGRGAEARSFEEPFGSSGPG